MTGIDILRLEDARDDSPQARSMLGLFEEDTAIFATYISGLLAACKKVVECENALSVATQTLAKKLQDYEQLSFPLGRDESILASTLKQFATTIEEVSSVHTANSSQLNDLMVQPLASFTSKDLTEIPNLKELTRMLEQEHENAVMKYCRVSKKKENETKARIDTNDELFMCRKKLLQNSLNYYNCLNLLQYKRTTSLLQPMLGFFQAQLAFFRMGKETLSRQMEEYFANITESLQSVNSEMGQLSQKSTDKIQELMEGSTYYFMPEPTPDMQMQSRPVNTSLSQIAGYLMIRSKTGLGHRWDRRYFFTQGGNLMSHAKGQIAGSLVIDLDGCTVNAAEIDDRRFVFQVTRPEDSKRLVTLQCMSESDRAEWIATIRNISSGFYMPEKTHQNDILGPSNITDTRSRALSAPPSSGSVPLPPGQEGGLATMPTGGTRPKQPMSMPSNSQRQRAESYKHSGKEKSRSSDSSRSSSQDIPATPPPSPLDSVLSTTPIQFDMISPIEEQPPMAVRHTPVAKEGPQRKVNPFGEQAGESRPVQAGESRPIQVIGSSESLGYVRNYILRFLGSMEVRRDKGLDIVMDTIRKIMAARAIHNIFKMTELNFVVTSQSLRLLDSTKQVVRGHHDLTDVSFWAAHQENKRLFAFITRRKGTRPQSQFICHVFEADVVAEEICQAISVAADIAFQSILQQRTSALAVGQKQDERVSPNLVLAPPGSPPTQMFDHPPFHSRLSNPSELEQILPPYNQPLGQQNQESELLPDQGQAQSDPSQVSGAFIPVHIMPSSVQSSSGSLNINQNNGLQAEAMHTSPNLHNLEGINLGRGLDTQDCNIDESDA